MALTWVILDAMGVVFEVQDDVADLLVPFIQARSPGTSTTCIEEAYHRASPGEITTADFWMTVGLGDSFPGVETEYLNACLTPDPGYRAAVTGLRDRFRVAMVSNDVGPWSAYPREKHGLAGLFDAAVISGDVGVRKPAAAIFEMFPQRTGASPGRCAFVDDLPRNLEAAARLGFKTIHFVRDPSIREYNADGRAVAMGDLPRVVARIAAA